MPLEQHLPNKTYQRISTPSNPQRCPLSTNTKTPTKRTRQKWTGEEYTDIMEEHYRATLNPSETSATIETNNIWRQRYPEKRVYLDANKLATVRRDII